MNAPLFTVIITTYNRKAILPRAIRSVLSQTCEDFELLVIDNGSTDSTEGVVRGTADSRVKYIRNPNPSKTCDAPRNLGIQMAAGRLISFLDDDDIWYPDKLEKTRKVLEDHPDISVVCHNIDKKVGEKPDGIVRCGPEGGDLYETLLYKRSCLFPSATTIRTSTLRELKGFNLRNEFDGVGDYDLWLRMAEKRIPMYFMDESLGEYTVSGQNLSITDTDFQARYAFLVRKHILNYEKRPVPMLSRKALARLLQMYVVAGNSFMKARQYMPALKYYLKAAFFVIIKPSLIIKPYSRAKKG